MADNYTTNPGVGGLTFASDDVSGVQYPIGKLAFGALDSATLVTAAAGLPVHQQTGAVWDYNLKQYGGSAVGTGNALHVQPGTAAVFQVGDNGASLTVDGTVGATQSGVWTVTGAGGTFPATDSGGSLTVDAPVGTPVFVRLSDGAAAITALPVTDNAGSLTVDGTVSITANSSVNVAQLAGTTTDTNSGNKSAGTLRVVLATDQPQLTNKLLVTPDANSAVNLAQVGGNSTATGNGAVTSGTVRVALADISAGEYETVAASQTDQALGATGATGDYLAGVLIVPATTSPGAVSIKDGGGSAITIFTGGASSVSNLVPFFVPLGIISGAGAWKVTTGTNVSAIGVGNFT